MAQYNIDVEKLLSDKRVVAEIERHLWLESEKQGFDLGYEKAKEDWLKNFSIDWMQYHMPQELINARKKAKRAAVSQTAKSQQVATLVRRRAKAYA